MNIIDLKFDSNQGDANIALDNGIVTIAVSDSNPNFPSGAKITVPLDNIFLAIEAKANSVIVGWMIGGLRAILDAIP